ncbi:MAG TPA: NAD(P)H-binding protein [Microbacteriaceae bacterium]|nr:NAD(P)H-binding protein [Microbacteriaceae bacterium]
MAKITVIGGTGYAGSHIVAEAAARGHEVVSYSRNAPATPVPGVTYQHGDAADRAALAAAIDGADVVIGALSPRGELAGRALDAYRAVAAQAKSSDDRLIIIGGFGGLRPAADAPRFVEDNFPEAYRPEALEMISVLEWLETGESGTDWVFVSPPAIFGAHTPGERTGTYRSGGRIALESADGTPTTISGADFAIAIVDEAESARHHRDHISFAS